MNKIVQYFLFAMALVVVTLMTVVLIHKNQKADFRVQNLNGFEGVSIYDIETNNSLEGHLKTSLIFNTKNQSNYKEFYGQELRIKDNLKVDLILIGITNHLISRIEVWNNGQLIDIKEKGFLGKTNWGSDHKMVVEIKNVGNNNIQKELYMRFYRGSGFLGDTGGIDFDLTELNILNDNIEFSVFAKSLESEMKFHPMFKNLEIWKNYVTLD